MTDILVDPLMHPSYILRRYAWAVLNANDPTTWTTAKYGGKMPVVPLIDEPDLAQYSGPRIVYEYTTGTTGSTYYRNRASMTFAVRDSDYERLTKTLNILQVTFERMDETARDLNDFAASIPGEAYDGIGFGYVSVGFQDGGTPGENEGGPSTGIISINFDYFVDYAVNTRPSL